MADMKSAANFAQLVADHHEAVYRYAYRLTGSVHDAEDLAQDVFFVLHRKMGQLCDVRNIKAWLFAILRNCFRKSKQRRWPLLAEDLSENLELAQISQPEDEFDRDRLQTALDRLPDSFKLVVLMYYFEQCTYREIAEQLDMPIGTVMSRLSRAKEHLRTVLFDETERTRQATVSAGLN